MGHPTNLLFRLVSDERAFAHLNLNPLNWEKGEMKKFSIAALLLLFTSLCFGQAPQTMEVYTPKSDVFVGYVVNLPNYGFSYASNSLQGYEIAYTLHGNARWGWTIAGGQTFRRISPNASQWQATAGPKFNILTGRFRPYGTAQLGFSNQDSNQLHNAPTPKASASLENTVTFRVGVGADYQLTRGLYWRIGQWAAQPVLWGRNSTALFQNFSSGIGFQF